MLLNTRLGLNLLTWQYNDVKIKAVKLAPNPYSIDMPEAKLAKNVCTVLSVDKLSTSFPTRRSSDLISFGPERREQMHQTFISTLASLRDYGATQSEYFLFFKDSTRVFSAPKQAVISSPNTQVNNQATTLQDLVQVNKAQEADQQTQLAQHVVELNQRLEKKSIQLKQSQQQLKLNQSVHCWSVGSLG